MKKKRWLFPAFLVILLNTLTFIDSGPFAAPPSGMYFSIDIPFEADVTCQEKDVLKYTPSGLMLYLSGSGAGIPEGVNLTAVDFDGIDILFCIDVPTTIAEQTFSERDIIGYDGSNFFVYLYGSLMGIPKGAAFDAVSKLVDGRVIFSLDIPVEIKGTLYRPNDLIVFDPKGSSLSVFFNGRTNGVPSAANIDGVWIGQRDDILFSLDVPAVLGKLPVTQNDIIRWDGNNFSIYSSMQAVGIPEGADIDALTRRTVELCEGDFEPDGDVDGADLAIFSAQLGYTNCDDPSPCIGDINKDSNVDEQDLVLFAEDFGMNNCP